MIAVVPHLIPPPRLVAVLPVKVQSVSVALPELNIPPPSLVAVLFENAQFVKVGLADESGNSLEHVTEAYKRFLMDHLTRIPGVTSIRSSFALKQVAYRTALPLAESA